MEDAKLGEVVFFLMERVMRRAKEITKEQFKAHGFDVTVDQWVILKRINEGNGISQVEIAQSTFKDPAAVTRMLDILCRKELVERKAKPEDRRAFMISLSPKGNELVERMTPVVQALRAKSLEDFSEDETTVLKKLVNKIYYNLEG